MSPEQSYLVKQVSDITGVSIRTLHYYDEIGLLKPTRRTAAGYRLYSERDLLRLQQIMISRSLGLSLEEIRDSLENPEFDYASALRRQRSTLIERLGTTHRMIASIDVTLRGLGEPRASFNVSALFDGFDPGLYADETHYRWGRTNAFEQSTDRTRHYTETDWALLKSELDAIWQDAATAMQDGALPSSETARVIVERHRSHINRWFYDLTPEGHVGLSQVWETDSRFQSNIDRFGAGLTHWLGTAISFVADNP